MQTTSFKELDGLSQKELDVLNRLLENGKLNADIVGRLRDMSERKTILSRHHYWQGKDGRWYTKLGEGNEIKLKSRSSEEAIQEVIVQYYKQKRDDPTVKEVFYAAFDQKLKYGEISKATFDRYVQDFNRFFKGKDIESMRFSSITEEALEDFIKRTIHDEELTAKGYSGLRLLLRGMLIFAKGKYTNISAGIFFDNLTLSKNIFRHTVKNAEKEVFTSDEIETIISALRDSTDVRYLGIQLVFYTGIRVGELVALKRDDVVTLNGNTYLHIQRTETRYMEDGKKNYGIKNFPKSEAGERYVYCSKEAVAVIERLLSASSESEYIFVSNKGKRHHIRAIDHALRKTCKKLGLPVRSMHKIRKTYGTRLIDAGVDESVIIEQMGHKDINCTRQYYYFSDKRLEEKKEQLDKVAF